jgi:hypothetical protein
MMRREEHHPEASQQLRRLCSEIQLFDLCDLERCSHKQGRFCTRAELLARFEQIAEEDECAPLRNTREEDGVDEDVDLDGYGSGYEEGELDEGYDGEDD